MVPFQRDKHFDAAASHRSHIDLGARLDACSTKADSGSTSSFDHSGWNTRSRFAARYNSQLIAQFLG